MVHCVSSSEPDSGDMIPVTEEWQRTLKGKSMKEGLQTSQQTKTFVESTISGGIQVGRHIEKITTEQLTLVDNHEVDNPDDATYTENSLDHKSHSLDNDTDITINIDEDQFLLDSNGCLTNTYQQQTILPGAANYMDPSNIYNVDLSGVYPQVYQYEPEQNELAVLNYEISDDVQETANYEPYTYISDNVNSVEETQELEEESEDSSDNEE